jgi:hypothetical protein
MISWSKNILGGDKDQNFWTSALQIILRPDGLRVRGASTLRDLMHVRVDTVVTLASVTPQWRRAPFPLLRLLILRYMHILFMTTDISKYNGKRKVKMENDDSETGMCTPPSNNNCGAMP